MAAAAVRVAAPSHQPLTACCLPSAATLASASAPGAGGVQALAALPAQCAHPPARTAVGTPSGLLTLAHAAAQPHQTPARIATGALTGRLAPAQTAGSCRHPAPATAPRPPAPDARALQPEGRIPRPLRHPPEAYLGGDRRQALAFFRENGFLLLPNAVPLALLERARAAVAQAGSAAATSPAVTTLLQDSGIWSFVESLVVEPMPPTRAQVSSVERTPMAQEPSGYFPEDLHIDGVFEDGRIDNFALLVGVPLSAFPAPFMGNFGVFPGSHLRLQELFRSEGPGAFRHESALGTWRAKLRQMFEKEPYQLLNMELGQAYIAHYQTVHFYHLNLWGADPRTVLYFRVWPRRGVPLGGFMRSSEPRALADVWREYRMPA